jgi:hypothetical protein
MGEKTKVLFARIDAAGAALVRQAAKLDSVPIAAWMRMVLTREAKRRVRAEERENV